MFFQRLYVDNWHLNSCHPCKRMSWAELCGLHTLCISGTREENRQSRCPQNIRAVGRKERRKEGRRCTERAPENIFEPEWRVAKMIKPPTDGFYNSSSTWADSNERISSPTVFWQKGNRTWRDGRDDVTVYNATEITSKSWRREGY